MNGVSTNNYGNYGSSYFLIKIDSENVKKDYSSELNKNELK